MKVVKNTIDNMFVLFCAGYIPFDEFKGALFLARECGLITDVQYVFLCNSAISLL